MCKYIYSSICVQVDEVAMRALLGDIDTKKWNKPCDWVCLDSDEVIY